MSINNHELIEENISIDAEMRMKHNKFQSTVASENPIVLQLIDFGYNEVYSRRVFYYLHPEDLEEALNYMAEENGIIQHRFLSNKRNPFDKLCYICRNIKENHLRELSISRNQEQNNEISNIYNINDINSSAKVNSYEKKEDDVNNNYIDDSDIGNKYINTQEELKSEETIDVCSVCNEEFIVNENNKVSKCGHSFCEQCWYNFLSIKINENKLPSIKCMDYECNEKINDEFIFNLLNFDDDLIRKYKLYKFELNILQDPNKKLCPHPNCNSYMELKDIKNKYVSCENKHKFCFLCLNPPHGDIPCEKSIDIDLKEYAQNNFVKKCPHCGIIIEKKSGCNHIICSKCGYQWCWLCNKEYKQNHFNEGKCRGFQFYQPKNEYEVKLVMEGKINYNELSDNQRQYNIDINHVINANQGGNQDDIEQNLPNPFIDRDINLERLRGIYDEHINIHLIPRTSYIFFFIFYLLFGHGICIPLNIYKRNTSKIMHIYICLPLFIVFFFQIIILNIIMLPPIIIGFCFSIKKIIMHYNKYMKLFLLVIINALFRQFILVHNILNEKFSYKIGNKTFEKILIFIPSFLTSFFIIFPQCILSNIFLIIAKLITKRHFQDFISDLHEELFENYELIIK